jgi:membrane protease YdiL (CAAX protease family)
MTPQDWLWPAIFLVLGVAGVFVTHHYYFQAFPEASVDLRLTRQEVEDKALDFLRGRGISTDGYHVFTAFNYDDDAKVYLERELGAEEANHLMATTVRIWNWRTRLIKPPQKEELVVHLTTSGELMGFTHLIDEAAPGASLSKAEAQRVAEVFLLTERLIELKKYHLVEDRVETRPKRLDYTLTWEENDFKAKDATHRLTVTITGDQVGGFKEFLKIPDQWARDYDKLRSRNNLLEMIATALYVILLIVAVFVIFSGGRVKKIHWKTALALGGFVAVLFFFYIVNEMPEALQNMPTQSTYGTLQALILVGALIAALGSGLYIVMLAASGEPLYREMCPDRVGLNHLFTFAGLRTKEFFKSTVIGYGMAGMHIGLVALFYTVALKLGAWAPMEVNYDNGISTMFPWLSPLAMASFAALSEEFPFRLFAIPLILRVTRRWFNTRWIAVLIPAFLWGFLHSSYPQQPAWIRGVEVGMIGIVAGWVFLNFGILTTLVWHYTVDAVLMGMFLLRSNIISYRIAGALVGDAVLIPLLISVVFYFEARGFVQDDSILNQAPEPPPAPVVATTEEPSTVDLDSTIPDRSAVRTQAEAKAEEPAVAPFHFIPPLTMRWLVISGLAWLIASGLVSRVTPEKRIEVTPTPAEAEQQSVEFLVKRGVDVGRYRHVTALQDAVNGSAYDYLVEHSNYTKATAIYRDEIHSVEWRTRFFRELQKEEYVVLTGMDGDVSRYVHILDEDAPGAKLDEHAAMAAASLAAEKAGINLQDYTLVDHHLDRRKNRDDHTITWESKKKLAGEATERVEVVVKGDEVNGPRRFVKIPEEWEREHNRQTVQQVLVVILFCAVGLAGVIFAAIAIPKVTVYWRLHMTLGAIAAALRVIAYLNDIPEWWEGYDTALTWTNAMTQEALGAVMGIMLAFLGVAALAVLSEVLLRSHFGNISFWPSSGSDRARAMLEGLFAGVCAVLILEGVSSVVSVVLDKVPSGVRGASPSVASYPVAFSPGLSLFLHAVVGTMFVVLTGAALAGTVFCSLRKPNWIALGLIAAAAIIAAAPSTTWTEFAKHLASLLVSLAVMALLVRVLRFNVFSWAVLGLLASSDAAFSLLKNPGVQVYGQQALVGIGVLFVAYLVIIRRELGTE